MLCIVFAITIARNLSTAWRVMAALVAEDTASSLTPSGMDAKRQAGGPDRAVHYLPVGLPEGLSDAFATVGSTRLPLHSQVLSTAASVLRDVFVTQEESGQQVGGWRLQHALLCPLSACSATALPPTPAKRSAYASHSCFRHCFQGTLDLSPLFSGHTLHDVTLFLRWAYSPQLASHEELQAECASLPAVLQLAHKLDTPALLHKLPQYWMGEALWQHWAGCLPSCQWRTQNRDPNRQQDQSLLLVGC